MLFPLENPQPDFETFREVLMGEEKPDKVYFAELGVDIDMINALAKKIKIDMKRIPDLQHYILDEDKTLPVGPEDLFDATEGMNKFYYSMGYDYVPSLLSSPGISLVVFLSLIGKKRIADDTAQLATKGVKRVWVEETTGIVTSWEDFEALKSKKLFQRPVKPLLDLASENLPKGMKIVVTGGSIWEITMERIMGYVNLFRKLFEDPALVKAVIDWVGEIVYNEYKDIVSSDSIGAVFYSDDLGYKKGTMVNPDVYREMVFPWYRKFVALAHQHGKMYWYHCCGNVAQVMEDLIEDVKIDAFHSFQDEIMPVWEFQKMYGDRIAVLGGVDVDKLARYDEESLRKYVRHILNECMPRGRYALGSGNSVTNYVPPKNYLTMLEEGLKWKPKK